MTRSASTDLTNALDESLPSSSSSSSIDNDTARVQVLEERELLRLKFEELARNELDVGFIIIIIIITCFLCL